MVMEGYFKVRGPWAKILFLSESVHFYVVLPEYVLVGR